MLELAILGVLKDREMHGYELKKALTDTLGPLSSVSFGSLYPALARLEAAGAVKALEPEQSALAPTAARVPMTGSLTGEAAAFRNRALAKGGSLVRRVRSRKVYQITPRGRSLFEELLSAEDGTPEDDKAFHLKLTFARFLTADARLLLLERRRRQLDERLKTVRSHLGTSQGRSDTYVRSLMEHRSQTTELDISWLDRLIEAETNRKPNSDESTHQQISSITSTSEKTPVKGRA